MAKINEQTSEQMPDAGKQYIAVAKAVSDSATDILPVDRTAPSPEPRLSGNALTEKQKQFSASMSEAVETFYKVAQELEFVE